MLNPELLDAVEMLLIEHPAASTFSVLAKALAKEYDVAESTIRKYKREVYQRWAKEDEEMRPAKRALFERQLYHNLELSWSTNNPVAGAATLRIISKFHGFDEPMKIEVSGAMSVASLSPEERRAEIQRLLERASRPKDQVTPE